MTCQACGATEAHFVRGHQNHAELLPLGDRHVVEGFICGCTLCEGCGRRSEHARCRWGFPSHEGIALNWGGSFPRSQPKTYPWDRARRRAPDVLVRGG